MKLTPEQKAFYEYGKARGILKERKDLMISMEGEFDAAIYYPEYRELYHIKEAIRDAWQKRAACRIKCGQCVHFSADEWGPRRDGCLKRYCGVKSNRRAVGCRYWEPRKEGE